MREEISKELPDIRTEHLNLYPISEESLLETYKNNPHMLSMIFLISISNDIEPYRRFILDKLQGDPQGQQIWESIVEELWEFENVGLEPELAKKRKGLYPKTLAEARRYFLREENQKN